MIQFNCKCGKRMQAKEEFGGMLTSCPVCKLDVAIPNVKAVEQDEPDIPVSARKKPAEGLPDADAAEDGDISVRRSPQRSRKALLTLIFGAASFLCTIFAGIPALVLGIWSLLDIRASRGYLSGKGLAYSGMALAVIGMIAMPITLIFGYPAMQKRSAVSGSRGTHLKQLAMALREYHDKYQCLPPPVIYSKDGKKALHGWRVAVLPFLGEREKALYNRFKLDQPWDSPHNRALLLEMPDAFKSEGRKTTLANATFFQVFVGEGAMFTDGKPRRFVEVKDGLENTILIVEANREVPWTAPTGLQFAPTLAKLGSVGDADDGFFLAALGDGTVRAISKKVPEEMLTKALTYAGAEDFVATRDLP